jgi:exosortase family protein XrtF
MRWILKLREFVRSQPDVFRFLVLGFGGYIIWHLSYETYLKPATLLDEYITENLIVVTEGLLDAVGYEPVAFFQENDGLFRNRVGIRGAQGVFVGPSCDGVVLFALFTIFILSFPGRWTRKLWFIPVGIIAIHAANIFRIISLLMIQLYLGEEALKFNHDYTFTVFVYSIIFALWYGYAAGAGFRLGSTKNPST